MAGTCLRTFSVTRSTCITSVHCWRFFETGENTMMVRAQCLPGCVFHPWIVRVVWSLALTTASSFCTVIWGLHFPLLYISLSLHISVTDRHCHLMTRLKRVTGSGSDDSIDVRYFFKMDFASSGTWRRVPGWYPAFRSVAHVNEEDAPSKRRKPLSQRRRWSGEMGMTGWQRAWITALPVVLRISKYVLFVRYKFPSFGTSSLFFFRRWTSCILRFWPSQRHPSTLLYPGHRLTNFLSSFDQDPVWCCPPIYIWVFLLVSWLRDSIEISS